MTAKDPKGKTSTRVLGSWCLYDFANSAFTTIVVTFVYATVYAAVIAVPQLRVPIAGAYEGQSRAAPAALSAPLDIGVDELVVARDPREPDTDGGSSSYTVIVGAVRSLDATQLAALGPAGVLAPGEVHIIGRRMRVTQDAYAELPEDPKNADEAARLKLFAAALDVKARRFTLAADTVVKARSIGSHLDLQLGGDPAPKNASVTVDRKVSVGPLGEYDGESLWAFGVGLTAILVALLSPILGAIADRGGLRKRFLLISTGITIIGGGALTFLLPGSTWIALVIFVVANIAFEMANVFYNAFLPDIADEDNIGRLSGYGWAAGYIGGLVVMLIALVALIQNNWFGLDSVTYGPERATNLLVAVWFLLFSIPMFLWVKEDRSNISPPGTPIVRESLSQLWNTFVEIRKYRQIVRFLLARLIFNDGLITIFSFGGIFAQSAFGFTSEKLIYFGLLLNITAAFGAFGMGFLDDKLGGKNTIIISLAALFVTALVALMANSEAAFWVATSFLGIFVGPNQSASRSLMGRFVPADKENEFFGFFALSGKATAFMGPIAFAFLNDAFGSVRAGLSIVLVFFLVGGLIMFTVDEKEGIAVAKGAEIKP